MSIVSFRNFIQSPTTIHHETTTSGKNKSGTNYFQHSVIKEKILEQLPGIDRDQIVLVHGEQKSLDDRREKNHNMFKMDVILQPKPEKIDAGKHTEHTNTYFSRFHHNFKNFIQSLTIGFSNFLSILSIRKK